MRDNINISLVMAVSLAASSDGKLIAPASPAADNQATTPDCGPNQGVSACTAVYTVTVRYTLEAGKEYQLRIAIETTRGNGVPLGDSAMAK